jgi:hypothetical protein
MTDAQSLHPIEVQAAQRVVHPHDHGHRVDMRDMILTNYIVICVNSAGVVRRSEHSHLCFYHHLYQKHIIISCFITQLSFTAHCLVLHI